MSQAPDESFTWPEPRAAYLHVPFCAHRCGYCNFTLVAGRDELIESYLDALGVELSWLATPRPVDTLFIGGGTPTHLPPAELARLLSLARHWFPLAAGYELSVEANPADITPERVAVLAEHGVNRVSLGAQSFRAGKLRLLERDHDDTTIRRAVELLRPVMDSISLDLIFGAPGETLAEWQGDVSDAIAVALHHVSTYGLTFERGTTFFGRLQRDELRRLDEDLERAMYEHAIDSLSAAGFEHYEVSNFAQPGKRCRHNEVYWNADSYFAAGPGAARYVGGVREINHRGTLAYLQRVSRGESPVAERESLAAEDRAREALVIGLRRLAGIDVEAFHTRFGVSAATLGGAALNRHLAAGLLMQDKSSLRLTRAGLMVSDSLWSEYLRA